MICNKKFKFLFFKYSLRVEFSVRFWVFIIFNGKFRFMGEFRGYVGEAVCLKLWFLCILELGFKYKG